MALAPQEFGRRATDRNRSLSVDLHLVEAEVDSYLATRRNSEAVQVFDLKRMGAHWLYYEEFIRRLEQSYLNAGWSSANAHNGKLVLTP